MIDNYFSKNGTNCIKKNKINTIPVEKYKENKKLFINTPKKINNQKKDILNECNQLKEINDKQKKDNNVHKFTYFKFICIKFTVSHNLHLF